MAQPKTFNSNIHSKFQELEALMIRKQRDYGPGNILNTPPSVTPRQGLLLRMNDKVQRLGNLLASGVEPENESLIDTAMDIANYGLILWCVLDSTFGLPLAPEGSK